MGDIFARARSPRWRFLLLNQSDQEIGTLTGVDGGNYQVTSGSPIGETGTLTYDQAGSLPVDHRTMRVRAVYDPGIPGVAGWPVATALFQAPVRDQDDGSYSYQVKLVGKCSLLERRKPDSPFVAPVGANPVGLVAALIGDLLGEPVSVTETDKTLAQPMVMDEDHSWLTIMNELLASAGYRSLWVDEWGVFQLTPYTLPVERPVVYLLSDSTGRAVHRPFWSFEPDLEIPNHVRLIQQGSGDEPGLVANAYNDDPDDPTSTVNSPVLSWSDSAEFTDQATGDALAARKLVDLRAEQNRLTIEHAPLPLRRGDRVRFEDQGAAFDGAVWSTSWTFDEFADQHTELRLIGGHNAT